MSRKVTRNDFGSLAYLSPERIESGGDMDATDGFWARRRDALRDAARRAAVQRARHAAPRTGDRRAPAGAAASTASARWACRRSWPSCSGPRRPIAIRAPRRSATISSGTGRRADTEAQKEGWPGRAGDEPATRRIEPLAPAPERPKRRRGAPCRRRCRRSCDRPGGGTTAPFPSRAGAAGRAPARGAGRRPRGSRGPLRHTPPPRCRRYPSGRAARPRASVPGAIGTCIGGLFRASQPVHRRSRRSCPSWNEMSGRPRRAAASPTRCRRGAGHARRSAGRTTSASRPAASARRRGGSTSMLTRRTLDADRSRHCDLSRRPARWCGSRSGSRRGMRGRAPSPPIPARPDLNAALRYVDGHLHRINGDAFRRRQEDDDAARREFADGDHRVPRGRGAAQQLARSVHRARPHVRGRAGRRRPRRRRARTGAPARLHARASARSRSWPTATPIAAIRCGAPHAICRACRRSATTSIAPPRRISSALELYAGAATFGGVPASVRRAQVGTRAARSSGWASSMAPRSACDHGRSAASPPAGVRRRRGRARRRQPEPDADAAVMPWR